jgi:5-methylcytosine-specific restriction endonuclease McrA
MTSASRQAVRRRARNRCEYCRIHQDDAPFLKHQIEHIIPRQHHGGDNLANLALACYRCNKFKGPNLSAFDPQTGKWPAYSIHADSAGGTISVSGAC